MSMSKSNKLFSFVILSYNNFQYIYEAVDSVLKQTYSPIELLISNDGSPDFKAKELKEYIERKKSSNIVHVDIHNNAKNLGTVRNVESARQRASGEFIMYMAADDALYDETILQRYASEFDRLGDKAMVLSSRTAMCGSDLNVIMDYFPDEEGVKVIRDGTPEQLFSRMCHTFTIPTTSTCYRMSLYTQIGPYDTEYFIIEDASFFMRLSRLGVKIHWMDDITGARHRDGGISHSKPVKITESYRKYRHDEILLFEKEILPYVERIPKKDRELTLKKWEWVRNSYHETFEITEIQRIFRKISKILDKVVDTQSPSQKGIAIKGTLENTLVYLAVLSWSVSAIAFVADAFGIIFTQEEAILLSSLRLGIILMVIAISLQLFRFLFFYLCKGMRLVLRVIKKVRNKRG